LNNVWGRGPEPADIRIEWQDGLPADPMEDAQVESIRTGSKATTSVRSAVRRLDGIDGEQLEKELKEIQGEQEGQGVTELPPITLPGVEGEREGAGEG
jgi:hypothetical protein